MKKRLLLVLLILSLGMNTGIIGTFGYHWLRHRLPAGNLTKFEHRMKRELRLDDAQMEAMKEDRKTLDAATAQLRNTIDAKRREFWALIATQNAYSPETDRLIGEIGQLQVDMERTVTRHMFETKKVLSPDQQAKFFAMLQKGFQKHTKEMK